jgi:hypothetical protein
MKLKRKASQQMGFSKGFCVQRSLTLFELKIDSQFIKLAEGCSNVSWFYSNSLFSHESWAMDRPINWQPWHWVGVFVRLEFQRTSALVISVSMQYSL